MTLEKFRLIHSELIEHYQFIEHNLEGIYAIICKKDFISGLEDVEKSNIGRIVNEIMRIEKEENLSIIPQEIYEQIGNAIERRNFWCHNCYVDMTFKLSGELKKQEDINRLISDMRDAEELRKILFEIKSKILHNKRPMII